jgi:hypothetical protein
MDELEDLKQCSPDLGDISLHASIAKRHAPKPCGGDRLPIGTMDPLPWSFHLRSCSCRILVLGFGKDVTETECIWQPGSGAPGGQWVSVISVSELRRALRNQSLDVEIMHCIARMRSPNVSSIAEELGIDRKSVRYHLYKLKGEGCVRDRWVRMTTATGLPILCHEWPLTKKGERLLREGGLIFKEVLCNGWRPTSNTVGQPSKDRTA